VTLPQVRMPFRTVFGQAISTTQWYVRGKSHFTATGYLKHVKNYNSPVHSSAIASLDDNNNNDGVDDMTGKVVIVTGANSGIGKELATYAADKGANVYMLCRSQKRAEIARDEIIKATKNTNVKVLLVDVQELDQIRNVAKQIQSSEDKIDCLVCNAGVLLNERQESSEGIETTFASHLLGGSYLLSKLLLPQLRKANGKDKDNNNESSSSARVIFVSSGGMLNSKFPDWETATSTGAQKEQYDGNMAYTYAKRGQVLLAERFTKDYPDITWLSCHPGWTSTDAVEKAYGDVAKYLEPMRSTWQGAEGIAWLMSTPHTNLKSGEFYLDRMPDLKHIAGPFMTPGTFTQNSEKEVDVMMNKLKEACGGI